MIKVSAQFAGLATGMGLQLDEMGWKCPYRRKSEHFAWVEFRKHALRKHLVVIDMAAGNAMVPFYQHWTISAVVFHWLTDWYEIHVYIEKLGWLAMEIDRLSSELISLVNVTKRWKLK